MSTEEKVLQNCEDCKSSVVLEVSRIKADIVLINESMKEISDEVTELLEIFRASKGFIKVLGWLGKGLRWLAFTAAAIGALWALTKVGK